MMPYCRLIVYYMRGEEVVADDTTFEVEDVFDNQVCFLNIIL
jgi:Alpha-2-macroglobulin family N-terminal region.